MPLHDHFHPPLDEETSWDIFHGQWPAMIVQRLNPILPRRYVAGPHVHLGSEIEVDAAAFDRDAASPTTEEYDHAWQLSEPSVAVETELLQVDDYEVRVFDVKHHRRLVAVVEIVSPSNKDRPESRQIFAAKCAALLRQGVSVAIVDLVTAKNFNLYTDLLELTGHADPTMSDPPPCIYAAACRWTPRGRKNVLETWSHILHLGQPLPELPLWLAENFAVPLDLETSYEETCRVLRIS